MKLHTFYRSTAAYRVRIAANLKGIPLDYAYVNLVKAGGEHNSASLSRRQSDRRRAQPGDGG